MSNATRLRALRELIDKESPVDGIHNEDVRRLLESGGPCPRYLGCTSEGSEESTFRHNPDFFAGAAREIGDWLARSYEEGWAANWVMDLETGVEQGWKTFVQVPCESSIPLIESSIPLMIDTLALTGAANDALVAYVERLRQAAARGRLREAMGVRVPVDLTVEIVNRALGRGAAEIGSTQRLIGLQVSSADAA